MTFFHCSKVQSLCSLTNWSIFFWLASLISGFLKATQLFIPNPLSSLHTLHVEMLLLSLLMAQTKRRPLGKITSLTTRVLSRWGVEEQRNWTKAQKVWRTVTQGMTHPQNFHSVPIGCRPGNSTRMTMTSLRVKRSLHVAFPRVTWCCEETLVSSVVTVRVDFSFSSFLAWWDRLYIYYFRFCWNILHYCFGSTEEHCTTQSFLTACRERNNLQNSRFMTVESESSTRNPCSRVTSPSHVWHFL